MNVILHQANKDTRDSFGASRQAVDTFLQYLSSSEEREKLKQSFPDGWLYARGARDGRNRSAWDKIRPGNLALFFLDKTLIGSGTVVLTTRNPDLAKALEGWEPATSDARPHDLIYVVEDLKPHSVSREDVWAAIPRKWNDQFGLTVLTDDKADRLAEWLRSVRASVNLEQYEVALGKLRALESTDREVRALARTEQCYLQQYLFGSATRWPCSLCGNVFPKQFLVAAHVKPRSKCSEEERRDPNNIMAACVFGCDALFEHGYLTVENGVVRAKYAEACQGKVREIQRSLHNKPFRFGFMDKPWTRERSRYFEDHKLLHDET